MSSHIELSLRTTAQPTSFPRNEIADQLVVAHELKENLLMNEWMNEWVDEGMNEWMN